jgi:hypothetical protein
MLMHVGKPYFLEVKRPDVKQSPAEDAGAL